MSDTERAERGPYHHGNLAAALVDAGRELIEREGAQALTMRRVANRAGVTHAAPYRHFPDKTALLAAIADDGLYSLWRVVIDARHRGVIEMGRVYLQFAREQAALFHLMTRDAAPETLRRLHASLADELVAHFDMPAARARALTAAWHGLACLGHTPGDLDPSTLDAGGPWRPATPSEV